MKQSSIVDILLAESEKFGEEIYNRIYAVPMLGKKVGKEYTVNCQTAWEWRFGIVTPRKAWSMSGRIPKRFRESDINPELTYDRAAPTKLGDWSQCLADVVKRKCKSKRKSRKT
jgi:hypothetical protein